MAKDLDAGDDEHHRADPPDVARVPGDHTVVDDVGVEVGQVSVAMVATTLEPDDVPAGSGARRPVQERVSTTADAGVDGAIRSAVRSWGA